MCVHQFNVSVFTRPCVCPHVCVCVYIQYVCVLRDLDIPRDSIQINDQTVHLATSMP